LDAISLWAVLRSNSKLTGVAGDPSNSLAAGIEFVRRIPKYLFSAAVDDHFRAAGEQLPGAVSFPIPVPPPAAIRRSRSARHYSVAADMLVPSFFRLLPSY